jgi:predicted lipoprotein with Yx(FWY)xxD motif
MLALAALGAGACGSDSDDSGEPKGSAAPETKEQRSKPAAANGTAIKLADSQYGKVLFDRAGQAIYLFDKEKSDRSDCYDACAAAWPPVLTDGKPQAAAGIDASLLGTTRRNDGKEQVTYNGHPLYYYAHEGRNEVRCHNVREFGGLWLALDGKGNAID